MGTDQIIVFATIGLALALFTWDKFRHDIVAVICLLVLMLSGVIPVGEGFSGFSHPAVITVALVLVVSKGLENAGLVDLIGAQMERLDDRVPLQIAALSGIVCITSAFMNNIGALAVMMPVAIHIAIKSNRSASLYLMPLAFASLLGGMSTLIGTPPNIIVSAFREEHLGRPYAMFDFLPVAAGLILAGLIFITLIGWKLIPQRLGQNKKSKRFDIDEYITEVYVTRSSSIRDMYLSELKRRTDLEVLVLNVVRDNHLLHAPGPDFQIKPGDILLIEADSDDLQSFIEKSKVKLVGQGDAESREMEKAMDLEHIVNFEAVVMSESILLNESASSLKMRSRFGVNLLAVSRQGEQLHKRIDHIEFSVGDVLLLQGGESKMDTILQNMGCLPLADRGFSIGKPKNIVLALGLFVAAILLVVTGLLRVETAFLIAALGMVLTGIILPREIYTSIDWPVIVLLGAMLPVGIALETSGAAAFIAEGAVQIGRKLPGWMTLSLLFVLSMLLSNIINNAATVVLMAPIALSIADGLGLSADPFLMAVAISASAAFMTPIGHQSNTLVMGPGGYKFSDYARVGFPLSVLVLLIAIPLILFFWPL